MALAEVAAVREQRARVVLAERLAHVEVLTEAVAKGALEVVSNAFPALLDAVEKAIKPPAEDATPSGAGDGGLLELLVRADPERARRVLEALSGATGST